MNALNQYTDLFEATTIPSNVERFGTPHRNDAATSAGSGNRLNDRFVPSSTLQSNLPEGVTVCSLAHAALTMPDVVRRYYGQAARISDAGTALNTLLVQDGVLVHVATGPTTLCAYAHRQCRCRIHCG